MVCKLVGPVQIHHGQFRMDLGQLILLADFRLLENCIISSKPSLLCVF